MTAPLHLLDTVALRDDAPERGRVRGQVGTPVEALADGVWLAEFAGGDGRTSAMPALRDERVTVLRSAAAQAA